MYDIKRINKKCKCNVLYQSTWLIEETLHFSQLTICEHSVLKAPEGYFLTLIVNGIGEEIKPGTYYGDIWLVLTEAYHMNPHGLMNFNQISRYLHSAIVVENGELSDSKLIPEIIQGGRVDGHCFENAYIGSNEESFNGVVVAGNSDYKIKNVKIDFEGYSDNDFLGVGTAVTAIDQANVTIENCTFNVSGVTRCAIHAGGNSYVHVKNSDIINFSPATDWLGSFSWQICLLGSNRLVQLADCANVLYENCYLKSNGWGICSIDGTLESVKMHIKGCKMELCGPRSHGYGAFCIGENEVIMEDCEVHVNGYPLMLMGMEGLGKASIINSDIQGRRFGVFVINDDNSVLDIRNSRFKTDKSSLCIKGSSTIINIDHTDFETGNGSIVQLMDTEESGMNVTKFFVPVGIEDSPDPKRDLYTVSETEDITLNISNCEIQGNFYNSTSEIRAYRKNERGSMGAFHDAVIGVRLLEDGSEDPGIPLDPVLARHNGDDLRGAKNMGINLVNTSIQGVISSASQNYRDGVTCIDAQNRLELSNVTQNAAPTVNNGVVVTLDSDSQWIVTGTSYITSLTINEGAELKAVDGKMLKMEIDSEPVVISPGTYRGKIVLKTEEANVS